jgi:hypothetical protein
MNLIHHIFIAVSVATMIAVLMAILLRNKY